MDQVKVASLDAVACFLYQHTKSESSRGLLIFYLEGDELLIKVLIITAD